MERDKEMDELIIETAADFWHNNVLAGVPPEPDFEHDSTVEMFKRLYPGTNGQKIQADEKILAWAKVAQEAAAKASEYDKVVETAKNHLLAYMGDAAILRLEGNKVFRRRETKRKGYIVEDSTYIDARFTTTKE